MIVNPNAHDYDIKWPRLRSSITYKIVEGSDNPDEDVISNDPWPKLKTFIGKSGRNKIRSFEKSTSETSESMMDSYHHDVFLEHEVDQDSLYVLRRIRVNDKIEYEYHARVMLDKLVPGCDKYEITQNRIKANSLKPHYLISTLNYGQKTHFTTVIELPNAVLCIETVRSKANSFNAWIKFHHTLREEISKLKRGESDRVMKFKMYTKLMSKQEKQNLMRSWRDMIWMKRLATSYEESKWLSYDLELNIDEVIEKRSRIRCGKQSDNKWWSVDNG